MRLPHKTLERKLFNDCYRYVIGVDEVGMGSLAGPVVVCAVLFTKQFFKKAHKKLHWLRDSKLLASHQREKFAIHLLKEKNLKFQLSFCYPKTIDRLNIYRTARLAMRRAIGKLVLSGEYKVSGNKDLKTQNTRYKILDTIVLVDGKTKIEGLDIPQQAIIGGDRKIFAIACASVIAKVTRDKMMANYAKKYPDYGFEKHKGYGTKYHLMRLVDFGPCAIHRRSFAPVTKLL